MTMKDTTYSRHFGADDARAIRDAVKKDLGPATFKARPLRALCTLQQRVVHSKWQPRLVATTARHERTHAQRVV